MPVLIINGLYVGKDGKLEGIDVEKFKACSALHETEANLAQAIVNINGEKVEKDYEHISKYIGP